MSVQEIESKFEGLTELLKTSSSKIVCSMIIDKLDDYEFNRKAQIIYSKVKEICREQKVQYVFHNEISKSEECFREDKFISATKALAYL